MIPEYRNHTSHPLDSMDTENPKKRKREDNPLNESSKKMRVVPFPWTNLIKDMQKKIIDLLDFKTLLALDSTAKSFEGKNLLNRRWEELVIEELFDFNWSDLKSDLNPHKSRYLLGKATCCYVHDNAQAIFFPCIRNLQRIYKQFEGIMLRFPSFGAYVWKDLNLLRKLKNIKEEFVVGPKTVSATFERNFDLLQKSEEGGDLLLKALYRYRLLNNFYKNKRLNNTILPNELKTVQDAYEVLSKAIQKNATCISYLALEVFCIGQFDPLYHFFMKHFSSQAMLAIVKNNDYRGLEKCLWCFGSLAIDFLESLGLTHPPILAFKAMKDSNLSLKEKDDLFSESISKYGKEVPGFVLAEAGWIKLKLNEFEKAKSLYEQAFASKGFQPSVDDFAGAACVMFHFKKYEKSASFYDKALDGPICLTDDELSNAAFALLISKEFEKADALYESIFERIQENPDEHQSTIHDLINAGYIKLKLHQYDKAESFLDKISDSDFHDFIPEDKDAYSRILQKVNDYYAQRRLEK